MHDSRAQEGSIHSHGASPQPSAWHRRVHNHLLNEEGSTSLWGPRFRDSRGHGSDPLCHTLRCGGATGTCIFSSSPSDVVYFSSHVICG